MMVLPVRMLPLSDVTCERKSRSYPHHRISQDYCNPFPHYRWSLFLVCVLLQPSYPRFSNRLQYLHRYSWSLQVTSDHAYLGITAGFQTCRGWLTWKASAYYLEAQRCLMAHTILLSSSFRVISCMSSLIFFYQSSYSCSSPSLLVVTLRISFNFMTNS